MPLTISSWTNWQYFSFVLDPSGCRVDPSLSLVLNGVQKIGWIHRKNRWREVWKNVLPPPFWSSFVVYRIKVEKWRLSSIHEIWLLLKRNRQAFKNFNPQNASTSVIMKVDTAMHKLQFIRKMLLRYTSVYKIKNGCLVFILWSWVHIFVQFRMILEKDAAQKL